MGCYHTVLLSQGVWILNVLQNVQSQNSNTNLGFHGGPTSSEPQTSHIYTPVARERCPSARIQNRPTISIASPAGNSDRVNLTDCSTSTQSSVITIGNRSIDLSNIIDPTTLSSLDKHVQQATLPLVVIAESLSYAKEPNGSRATTKLSPNFYTGKFMIDWICESSARGLRADQSQLLEVMYGTPLDQVKFHLLVAGMTEVDVCTAVWGKASSKHSELNPLLKLIVKMESVTQAPLKESYCMAIGMVYRFGSSNIFPSKFFKTSQALQSSMPNSSSKGQIIVESLIEGKSADYQNCLKRSAKRILVHLLKQNLSDPAQTVLKDATPELVALTLEAYGNHLDTLQSQS